jgi:hypothetical protein
MLRWGVSLGALACALLAGGAAMAQTIVAPIPSVHPQVDGNGVDLVTGQLSVNSPQVSVGHGAGALSRAYMGAQGGDNFYGEITANGSVYTVNMGTSSEAFTYSGSLASPVFTNNQGSGSSLTGTLPHNDPTTNGGSSPSQYNFSYTMRDGTVVVFQNINDSQNYIARVVSLTKPCGVDRIGLSQWSLQQLRLFHSIPTEHIQPELGDLANELYRGGSEDCRGE